MATLKKYNLAGEQTGEVDFQDSFLEEKANSQSIKDYLVALRNNKRQWSASTQGRSDVNASKKKLGPQKGSGNARHGAHSAPQFKGGGVVFGPKPKFNQHTRINKQEKRAAIRYLISQFVKNGSMTVLETTEIKSPKTKAVSSFLNKLDIKGRTLFVGEGVLDVIEGEDFKIAFSAPSPHHDNLRLSLRNLPKTHFSLVKNLSGLDVAQAKNVVITEDAVNEMLEWLS